MKRIFNAIIPVLVCFFPVVTSAQTEIAKSTIAVMARYTASGAELRWIPDNKSILRLGFGKGYFVARSDSGANNFQHVATILPFRRDRWDSLIARQTDPERRFQLELASDFLIADQPAGDRAINLDNGIAELNEQKSREDMVYAIFVLSALRDADVAEALGLGFIDTTAKQGMVYTYRIRPEATSPVYTVDDGMVHVRASLNPDRYMTEVFVYPGDTRLSFAWGSTPELSGYLVERAGENEATFTPLNATPFYASSGSGFDGPTNGSFQDDSLTNYKVYRYRFYGHSPFGEKILFAEVEGMPRDLTPPNVPIISQPTHIKPREVKINWELTGDLSDLRGCIVARSESDTGQFRILHPAILPSDTRSFSDTTFEEGGSNYYVVYAMDTSGNISSSFPAYVALVDSTPPARPHIASAIIDSLGVVTITVTPGVEKDLMGYRVFTANSPDHELSVNKEAFRTGRADTNALTSVFADTVTLQSLTPIIYYRVKALDFNYNQSEFSELIAVTRPDTIPPVPPVITGVEVTDTLIRLSFVPSSSEDVHAQAIYRTTDLMMGWTRLSSIDSGAAQFIDTNVAVGVTYFYAIRAMDHAGLYSAYSAPVYGKPYDTGIRPIIDHLTATVEKRTIILAWAYPSAIVGPVFVIYKQDENGTMQRYDTTEFPTYTDTRTAKENFYAVKVMTKDGGQSRMSPVVGRVME